MFNPRCTLEGALVERRASKANKQLSNTVYYTEVTTGGPLDSSTRASNFCTFKA